MKYWLFSLLFLPLCLFAKNREVWNTDTLYIHLTKRILFRGQTEFRYGKEHAKLYYKHFQGSLILIRSQHTLIAPGYRQAYHRVGGGWAREYYPFIDLTFQTSSKANWFILNRSRLVYRIQDEKLGGHNLWLYRNLLECITPLRLTSHGIAPYLSNEIFWEESHGIDENRLILGIRMPYRRRTQLDLYYLLRLQFHKRRERSHENILAVHFSLHF